MALVHLYANNVRLIEAGAVIFLINRGLVNLWMRSWRRLDAPLATEIQPKTAEFPLLDSSTLLTVFTLIDWVSGLCS